MKLPQFKDDTNYDLESLQNLFAELARYYRVVDDGAHATLAQDLQDLSADFNARISTDPASKENALLSYNILTEN